MRVVIRLDLKLLIEISWNVLGDINLKDSPDTSISWRKVTLYRLLDKIFL